MDFSEAIKAVKKIIPELQSIEYDGIAVKRLEASNTLDEGRTTNQTHIAITGEQMDIFPYLMADGYFNGDYEKRDELLKKYFITQIPVYIYKANVEQLGGESSGIVFGNQINTLVHASIVRSRRKQQSDQVQLSLTTVDDEGFVAFRKLLHARDYLIVLKRKEQLLYDFWGISADQAAASTDKLNELHNKFLKAATNTKVDIEKVIKVDGSDQKNTGIGANILFYGVPGAGKSYEIDKIIVQDCSERIVFHPDYTYSDFVGQILPRIIKKEGEDEGKLRYVFEAGPFTKILKKAISDPDKKMYYLVIEEINRGNAPAIFGDVFQLLDRNDDGSGKYPISNYDIAKEVYGEGHQGERIIMPANLTILATMNTSDQNVFTLDTAFQRRWEMHHIKNDVSKANHADNMIEGSNVSWGRFATVTNEEIIRFGEETGSSEDKRLGAYFARINELSKDKFPEKVLKYLWDDAFKMDRHTYFNESISSIDNVIEVFRKTDSEDALKRVLRLRIYNKMIGQFIASRESDGETTAHETLGDSVGTEETTNDE